MLHLSHLHTHDGFNVVIPLYRRSDVFSFIAGISFSDRTSFEIDTYDILDLYKVENRLLLPKAMLAVISSMLHPKDKAVLFSYLWNELIESVPELAILLSEENHQLLSLLCIGHDWTAESLIMDNTHFHYYHDGHWTTFEYNNELHLKKWNALFNSIRTEIEANLMENKDEIIDQLYVLWEKELELIKELMKV